jgi:serine/threonine protein kinase
VKLGDFGLSKRRTEATAYRSHAGTQSYMAPEMFHYVPGLNPDSSEYTNAVDIWALGCITYRILTGKPPFPELWLLQRYCCKSNLPMFLQGLSEVETGAEQFVRQLLAPHPGERLTASNALEHPWLSKNAQTAVNEVSHIDQRSSHSILADTTHRSVFKDARPPPTILNYSQGQYNYNTASHAGLRSNHQSEASQNTTVRPAPVNQWPEANRLRMREPMPSAFRNTEEDKKQLVEGPANFVVEINNAYKGTIQDQEAKNREVEINDAYKRVIQDQEAKNREVEINNAYKRIQDQEAKNRELLAIMEEELRLQQSPPPPYYGMYPSNQQAQPPPSMQGNPPPQAGAAVAGMTEESLRALAATGAVCIVM